MYKKTTTETKPSFKPAVQINYSQLNTRIKINKENNKELFIEFIKDFFYEDLVDKRLLENNQLIIRDGSSDIKYEMFYFSKKYPDYCFTVELFNWKTKKVVNILKIKDGCIESENTVKNNDKINNKTTTISKIETDISNENKEAEVDRKKVFIENQPEKTIENKKVKNTTKTKPKSHQKKEVLNYSTEKEIKSEKKRPVVKNNKQPEQLIKNEKSEIDNDDSKRSLNIEPIFSGCDLLANQKSKGNEDVK